VSEQPIFFQNKTDQGEKVGLEVRSGGVRDTSEEVDRLPDHLPPEDIIKMTPVNAAYRKVAMKYLKNYRCKGKDCNVLLGDTQHQSIGGDKVYLYWMEEGIRPFQGAVCVPCYMKCQPKRRRRRKGPHLPGE